MFGGTKRRFGLALGLAASAAALAAVSVNAADLSGGGAVADLEERIAELEATTARKGNRKVKLEVSGFVNEALFAWDDGKETNAYVVTNETAQDRVRFKGDAKITDTWSAGYLLELGIRGARQDRVNQDNAAGTSGANGVEVRHSAWWLVSKELGKVWVGQTSDAADGITEVNLANTNHFASAAVSQSFGDGGGGFFLRRKDTGALVKSVNWGDLVAPGQSGIPGEGHRQNLVKYETPVIAGFTGSASWGEDDVWNIALRYAGEHAGFKLAGGIAYTNWTDGSNASTRRGALVSGGSDIDVTEVGLSASVLHTATGLYATGAYGELEDNNKDKLYGFNTDDTTDFFFIQVGIERKFIPLGKTTIFGEYWQLDGGTAVEQGNKLNVSGLGKGQYIKNSELRVWGLGLNQNLSEVVDLYISYRHVEADINTVDAAGVAAGKAAVDDFQYVTTGAYIKF